MVEDWFLESTPAYNEFLKALLEGDLDAMNTYMNRVSLATFSQFDTGRQPSEAEPERFYHGFVLGLMVDLADQYRKQKGSLRRRFAGMALLLRGNRC